MSSHHARRLKLRKLMADYDLTSAEVAELLGRVAAHVRCWMAGIYPIPAPMLRLLELELKEKYSQPELTGRRSNNVSV